MNDPVIRLPGGPDDGQWTLRPVTIDDVDGLHALTSKPEVYRYLFGGNAPETPVVRQMIDKSLADMSASGVGMWVLKNQMIRHAGAAWLKPDPATRSAELGYLLDPEYWGRGLALRMAWTAIQQAFATAGIDRIVSGTDHPNARSRAVMKRMGMQFHANVTYPLGPGVEYVLRRGDPDPSPAPALLRISV